MPQTILIILELIIIILLLKRGQTSLRQAQDKLNGICSAALDQTVRENANKEKILTILAAQDEASNHDIRKILSISERSVVRYMDELEREGKVLQMGDTGRGVTYCLK